MTEPSAEEIHAIVQRVVSRTLGLSGQSTPAELVPPTPVPMPSPAPSQSTSRQVVAIGADHGGFDLKETLKKELSTSGYEVIDAGAYSKEAVDYPDFAHEVARLVASGKAWRGIMIDGAGIGSCIVANKVPGVRAGMAHDLSSALNSREHNDTNVLTLGAGLIGGALAKQIVKTWLTTEFGGGRHQPRVAKIIDIESLYTRK